MTVETQNLRTTNNSHCSSDLSTVTATDIVKCNNIIWRKIFCDNNVILRPARLIFLQLKAADTHTYIFCVCVSAALVIQHAKRMRSIILPSVACLTVQYNSTLSHKRQEFRKKI
jgi:hypothetical protein